MYAYHVWTGKPSLHPMGSSDDRVEWFLRPLVPCLDKEVAWRDYGSPSISLLKVLIGTQRVLNGICLPRLFSFFKPVLSKLHPLLCVHTYIYLYSCILMRAHIHISIFMHTWRELYIYIFIYICRLIQVTYCLTFIG